MGAKAKGGAATLAFDVGKASHRAYAVDAAGAVLFSREVANRPTEIDRALADAGARVGVGQKRNIGALVVARARAAGDPVSYLPGIAMKKARDMFPVTAKTDATGAEVIARTAAGMPWTLREVAEETPASVSLRMLVAQRDFAVGSRTRAANRLRTVLFESDPVFEAAVDPSSRWQVAALAPVSSGRPELAAESELVRAPRRAHLRLPRRGGGLRGTGSSSGTETVINGVVTNTVLTDFLNLVEDSDSEPPTIRTLAKCKIKQIPGSISGMSLLTPYFSMFRGGQTIEAGDFDIALDKFDSTLSKAKDYFEFFGLPSRDKPVKRYPRHHADC